MQQRKIALGSALLQLKSVTDVIDDNQTVLRAGACSLSKFVRDGEDKTNHTIQWKIVMNGNCEFLTQGEEMNWDFRRGVEAGSAEDIAQRKAAAEAEAEALKKMNKPTDGPITESATGAEIDGNEDEFEVRKT